MKPDDVLENQTFIPFIAPQNRVTSFWKVGISIKI